MALFRDRRHAGQLLAAVGELVGEADVDVMDLVEEGFLRVIPPAAG